MIEKKKIYISDKLLKILSDKELKAIYYHEEGHKKTPLPRSFISVYYMYLVDLLFSGIHGIFDHHV